MPLDWITDGKFAVGTHGLGEAPSTPVVKVGLPFVVSWSPNFGKLGQASTVPDSSPRQA